MSTQKYFPYMGLEFHLTESIKTGKTPELSKLHFEAGNLYQEAASEKDFDFRIQKIKKYKKFCEENKIKQFSFAEKVKAL